MADTRNTRSRLSVARLSQQASSARRGIQIGPRIRVGGTLGKIGESVKQHAGQVAKIASVPLSFMNPALGAALAAGGRALHTNEGAAGLGDLAGAAGKAYALGKVGQGIGGALKGAGSIGSKLGSLGGALKQGIPAIKSLAGGNMPNIPGLPGGFDAMGVLGGIDAVRQQQQARDTQNKAMQYATDSYDARQPLRTQGMAGMLNPKAPPALAAIQRNKGNHYGAPQAPASVAPLSVLKRLQS